MKYRPMSTAPRDGTAIICLFTEECGGGTRKVSFDRESYSGILWISLESPLNQQIVEGCFDGWKPI